MSNINKKILKEASRLRKLAIAFFTCYIWEELVKDEPKKKFGSGKGIEGIKWKNIKAGDWTDNKIESEHNCLIVITGSPSNGLIGIDWDLYEYNKDIKDYMRKDNVYELMIKMQEEIENGNGLDTYVQSTGNNGYHWLFRYNKDNYDTSIDLPNKIGNSKLKIKGINCGDIRGEGGLLIWNGTSYMGVNGEIKEYEVFEDKQIDNLSVEILELDCINSIGLVVEDNDKRILTKSSSNIQSPPSVSVENMESMETNIDRVFKMPEILNNEADEVAGLLYCIQGWENRDTWMHVCFALSRYPQYYNLVHKWASQTLSKYDKDATVKYLDDEGKKYNFGIGTLYFMALKNTERFNEVFNKPEKNHAFLKAINDFNHNNLANYFYQCYKYYYAYSEYNKKWYLLNPNNTWLESDDEKIPLAMHNELIKTLDTRINNYIKYLVKKKENVIDEKQRVELLEQIKECRKNNSKLGMTSFIKGIKEFLPGKFLNSTIHEKLNSQRNIFAFENCVFDTFTKIFRDISPQDYITFTTGYEYNHNNVSKDKIKELMNILNGIFIAEVSVGRISQVEFILNIWAGCLYGMNYWQKIFICTGSGSNAKTMLLKLVEITFGTGYFKDIKSTFLTEQQTNAGSATAELTDKQYNRIMILSEPTGELVACTVKIHTGGDKIQSRGLYQRRVVSFEPQYTLFMLCNGIPKIKKPDSGFDRRITIIEFTRKFVDNPTRDFERKKDRSLEVKIKTDTGLRDALMWILIEQFKKLNMDCFIMDELTEIRTNEYIASLNPLLDYIDDYLQPYIVSGTAKAPYKMLDIYNDYKLKYENDKLNYKDFNEIMRYNNFVSKKNRQGYVWGNLIDPNSEYGVQALMEWNRKNGIEVEENNGANTEQEIDMD